MKIDIEIIERYKSGKYSMNDYLMVKKYFSEIKYHSDFIRHYAEKEDEEVLVDKDFEPLLDKIHHKIHSQESGKQNNNKWTIRLYNSFSKIAVVLLIPALISSAFLLYTLKTNTVENSSTVEIYSPAGARTHFILPDGSEGWLNSNSSIEYQVNFEKERKLAIKGEAWFDVVHNKTQEFVVQTAMFDIKVLGTRFNVLSYKNDSISEVILEEGKVAVTSKNGSFSKELLPDQLMSFNKNNKVLGITRIDSKSYNAWKDGKLIFRNDPMSKLVERLERKFNTDIVLHGERLKNMVLHATFEDENLEDILKLISIMEPIEYKIHRRYKMVDDTFSRTKVDIWLKNNTLTKNNSAHEID